MKDGVATGRVTDDGTLPTLASFPEEIAAALEAWSGVAPSLRDARRLLTGALGPEDAPRRPVSRRVREAAAAALADPRLELLEVTRDPGDGFRKFLFRTPGDGALTEAVLIPLHRPGRFTVCLSSQVGCAMGCAFCATGRLGLTRNLETWEMLDAFRQVRNAAAPGRVTGAVFMGQGEPLQNYDRVVRAARLLSHPAGGRIAGKAITVSTVGVAPAIRRWARERHPFRLVVSLTSLVPERRRALLPVVGRAALEELLDAIEELAAARLGQRVTVAWVAMSGVNTGDDEVDALRRRLGHLPLRLNLIDVNDPRPDGFRPPDDAERSAFLDRLQVLGVPVVRRYTGGKTRDAACGMLAARRHESA